MNSDSVDLVYLDPPFNSKANYAAPIGSRAAGAAFKDTWSLSDVDVEWINLIEARHPALQRVLLAAMDDSDKSYLAYMAVRLLEVERVLKTTGSIYLHCDPTMSHSLKSLMDAVFGKRRFRNEIIWSYGGRGAKAISRQFPRNHDVLLYYAAKESSTYNRVYQQVPISRGFQRDELNRPFKTAPRGDYTDSSIEQLKKEGRIHITRSGNVRIKYFLSESKGVVYDRKIVGSVWNIPDMMHAPKAERMGYPTQKPLRLLERVIRASSNEGDVVLDPFCGCATTLVASETLNRKWVGIDLSPKAVELVRRRLPAQHGAFGQVVARTDVPQRVDLGELPSPKTHKQRLYGRQHGNCSGCGEHFKIVHLEVDHIIAKKKGGTDHVENLQLLCGHCNRVKGDRGMPYLRAKLQLG